MRFDCGAKVRSPSAQREYYSSNFHNSLISWLVARSESSVPSDSTLPFLAFEPERLAVCRIAQERNDSIEDGPLSHHLISLSKYRLPFDRGSELSDVEK